MIFSLPEFNLKKKICSSWEFHVNDLSESSRIYDMIIGQGRNIIEELGMIMNFNDQMVNWDTDN
jgi:hypothetical protein